MFHDYDICQNYDKSRDIRHICDKSRDIRQNCDGCHSREKYLLMLFPGPQAGSASEWIYGILASSSIFHACNFSISDFTDSPF
jgi:hypothetical protein